MLLSSCILSTYDVFVESPQKIFLIYLQLTILTNAFLFNSHTVPYRALVIVSRETSGRKQSCLQNSQSIQSLILVTLNNNNI